MRWFKRSPQVSQWYWLTCGCEREQIVRENVIALTGEHRWCTVHQVFATVKAHSEEEVTTS